jgi:hypothetical protein
MMLHSTKINASLAAGLATPAVQSDGIAALGVASARLVGLYAKRKGIEVQAMVTTMIGTAAIVGDLGLGEAGYYRETRG